MNDPKFVTLNDLIKDKIFYIPEYQRGYSWKKKQRNDLFQDIERMYEYCKKNKRNKIHFMSTIVGLKKSSTAKIYSNRDHFEYDVVDGQQRLTSLIILMKVLSQNLKRSKDKSDKEIGARLENILIKEEDHTILIHANHDSNDTLRHFFTENKINQKLETESEKNIADAINDSEAFIISWHKDKKPLKEMEYILSNMLRFIFHEILDMASVYEVFEVVNSRGLDVNHFDKSKSTLMGVIFENLMDNDFRHFSSYIEPRFPMK